MTMEPKLSDPFRLYRETTSLRLVKRFQLLACVSPISVAEHSFNCAMLGAAFARQLRARGVVVDVPLVIESALWHDLAEAITGDTPHQFKRATVEMEAAWDQVDEMVTSSLIDLAGCEDDAPVPANDSLEALLVRYSDWAELILYVQEEQRAGNGHLNRAAEKIWHLLKGMPMVNTFSKHGQVVLDWYLESLVGLERSHRGSRQLVFGDVLWQ